MKELGGVTLRSGARPRCRRFAVVVMMAAAMAFIFETSIIATSEAATAEDNHSHHDNASHSPHGGHQKTHVVTHVHADGTVHRHDVDGALDDHIRESGSPCWSMAVVFGVLPSPGVCTVEAILIGKLAIEGVDPYRGTEPDVPGRPPRPPSIA
jgi:ABC-type nickel/cobalt efflux system permease component RcnA